MKAAAASAGVLLVCGCLAAAPAGAAAKVSSVQLDMLGSLNKVRAQHGLRPLGSAPALHRSARRYARWMLRADYFGHLSRIRASSRFSPVGENLAWHSARRPRVRLTVRMWMHSPTHRALILNPGFQWLGAGKARGRLGSRRATVWVLHFGGPRRPTAASLPPGTEPQPSDQLLSEPSVRSAPAEIDSTTSAAGAARASGAD